ncbi:MAG: hypothetical protein OXB84_02735 [Halobacteriovoraceae bacterium]|nr:hypothetical protein [Halobacteriovoraceae bacterium]
MKIIKRFLDPSSGDFALSAAKFPLILLVFTALFFNTDIRAQTQVQIQVITEDTEKTAFLLGHELLDLAFTMLKSMNPEFLYDVNSQNDHIQDLKTRVARHLEALERADIRPPLIEPSFSFSSLEDYGSAKIQMATHAQTILDNLDSKDTYAFLAGWYGRAELERQKLGKEAVMTLRICGWINRLSFEKPFEMNCENDLIEYIQYLYNMYKNTSAN